ncbi:MULTISPECIES: recombinase family protein [unclassified Methylobacterium]|uniref:recombinase family protein n=1 Tax=unclassified Methylobacterium TaxID=2615210 RepID=UPI0013526BDF|nr:hypothetical protein [Methylobacterium sp. 2A]
MGYARCSTDKQNLAVQRAELKVLGVAPERIHTDYGLIGTNRSRPGLERVIEFYPVTASHYRSFGLRSKVSKGLKPFGGSPGRSPGCSQGSALHPQKVSTF